MTKRANIGSHCPHIRPCKLTIFVFSMLDSVKVLAVRMPFISIYDAAFQPPLFRLIGSMRALEAAQLAATTVGMEIVQALAVRTLLECIQTAECAADNDTEMAEQCLYNRRTGEFVATHKK